MTSVRYDIAERFSISVSYETATAVTHEFERQYQFLRHDESRLPVVGRLSQRDSLRLPSGALELVKDFLFEDSDSLYVVRGGIFRIVAHEDAFEIEFTAQSYAGMVFHVMEVLVRFYAPLHDFLFVHASAFIRDGRVTVLNAFGGAGKTEVMLKALLSGAQFLADDLCIINKVGQVYPYPVTIPLRIHHYDASLLAQLRVPRRTYDLALWCMKRNGRLTRRIYNWLNLRFFVRNLPYTAFTDQPTPLHSYTIDHFFWLQSSDATQLSDVTPDAFCRRMAVCLDNESRKYFDCDGFLRYKFPHLIIYKERHDALLRHIVSQLPLQALTVSGRDFDALAALIFNR